MRVSIIGAGYVGLATGISLCKKGHKVSFYDTDKKKIGGLKKAKIPFVEENFKEGILECLSKTTMVITHNLEEAIKNTDIVFICVGTPNLRNGKTYPKDIEKAISDIRKFAKRGLVVAIKSTINVDIYRTIKSILPDENFHIAVNPEFLREGSAFEDSLNPSRIVIGTEDNYARSVLEEIYKDFKAPKIFTDPISAILIKYSSNAFLATKISFINEIANLADVVGGNIDDIALGIGLDPRIGKDFLKSGIGFGGSCLPKDTKNIIRFAKDIGKDLKIIEAAYKVNEKQYEVAISKLRERFGSLQGRTIAIFGLAFKGGTNDLRNSASLKIVQSLQKEGAILKLQDYLAYKEAKKAFNKISISKSPYAAAKESDAIVIATDCEQYRKLNWIKLKKNMKGKVIIDGKNILDGESLQKIGFTYEGIGKK